jgi:hypothetical protein
MRRNYGKSKEQKRNRVDKTISCYSTRALLKYARSKGLDITDLLVKVDEIPYVLLESEHWTTMECWKAIITFLYRRLSKTVFDIAYDLTKKENGNLDYRLGLIVLIPLPILRKTNLLSNIMQKKVNKNLTTKLVSFDETKNEMCLYFAPLNMEDYCKEICEYNKGVAKALMELKGYTKVVVNELECCFNDKPRCFLKITWTGKSKDTEKGIFKKLMAKLKSVKDETLDMPRILGELDGND